MCRDTEDMNMALRVQVGWWIEESQQRTAHTGYAADHIEHRTVSGRYPLMLEFVTGYSVPMPYWLIVKIDTNVVDGGYYSGFAGNNFAFTPAERKASTYHIQAYWYQLPELVACGQVEMIPGREWTIYACDYVQAFGATWADIRRMLP